MVVRVAIDLGKKAFDAAPMPDPGLIELFSYVKPEFRSSTNLRDLIAWAMAMASHFDLALMIGIISNHRTQAKVRHYRRALGEPVGTFFLFNATTGIGVH